MRRRSVSDDAVERTVQLTGNSTFAVSLPKAWARDQGIESGERMYLYPHDDRIVAAPAEIPERDRSTTIDVTVDTGSVERRVRAAYVTGADRITVRDTSELSNDQRRRLERTVSRLLGIEIEGAATDRITIRNYLDAGELSLPQTVAQLRQLVLEVQTDAIDAVAANDEELARRVGDRTGDVERLTAFVHRSFHRGLESVREIDRIDTDRAAAFRTYQTARSVERIATQADRIATVARRQSSPPSAELSDRLEDSAADAHRIVELAFDERASEARRLRESLEKSSERLDRRLYGVDEAEAPLYGAVVGRLERIADYGVALAETRVEGRPEG